MFILKLLLPSKNTMYLEVEWLLNQYTCNVFTGADWSSPSSLLLSDNDKSVGT